MPERLPSLSSRQVEGILRRLGFLPVRSKGSHLQLEAVIGGRKRRVTLVMGRRDLKRSTIESMIEQSGFREEDWIRALRGV